ncbi:MAG: AAA family ATPase, partial [Candidatus Omnitrophota bacterium]
MLKNTVLQQKNERDQMLSRPYITREKLSVFKKSLNSGLVKVITGPRRAGKSVFAFLLLKGQDFAYLNFDDESLLKENDYDKLLAALL